MNYILGVLGLSLELLGMIVAMGGAAAIPAMFVFLGTVRLSVVGYAVLAIFFGCAVLVAGQMLARRYGSVLSEHSACRFGGLPVRVTQRRDDC